MNARARTIFGLLVFALAVPPGLGCRKATGQQHKPAVTVSGDGVAAPQSTGATAEGGAFARVSLLGVDFRGGLNVYALANGTAFFQRVYYDCSPCKAGDSDPKKRVEQRFEVKLGAEQMTALEAAIDEHDFFSLKLSGDGAPGDSYAQITVTLASGQTRTVSGAASQQGEDFHAIWQAIAALAKPYFDSYVAGSRNPPQLKLPPVFQGPYDPTWKPAGF